MPVLWWLLCLTPQAAPPSETPRTPWRHVTAEDVLREYGIGPRPTAPVPMPTPWERTPEWRFVGCGAWREMTVDYDHLRPPLFFCAPYRHAIAIRASTITEDQKTQQLAALLKPGMPIDEARAILAEASLPRWTLRHLGESQVLEFPSGIVVTVRPDDTVGEVRIDPAILERFRPVRYGCWR